MPQVEVVRSDTVAPEVLQPILELLPEVVAESLTCNDPGGQLSAEDIEVLFRDGHDYDCGGPPQHPYHLQIRIFANDFPSRRNNLDTRRTVLIENLRSVVPRDLNVYIWILLCPGSFGTVWE